MDPVKTDINGEVHGRSLSIDIRVRLDGKALTDAQLMSAPRPLKEVILKTLRKGFGLPTLLSL